MNTWTIFAMVLALAVCQIAATPRRGPIRSGGRGRPRDDDAKAICKLNTTEIDYDEPCDLPDYYECVPRDNNGTGNGRSGASNYGRRGGRHGGHDGGRHGQEEISFCEQKNCIVDSDCVGDFSCLEGVCDITRDMKMYAVACIVTDVVGDVRKERACPGEMVCGPCPREIVYDDENLTASFCRRESRGGRGQRSSEEEDDCSDRSTEDDSPYSEGDMSERSRRGE